MGNPSSNSGLVKFRARILLAVPGTSLNNREYPKETLQQCAPLYEDKPFILDHDIEHAERVIGVIYKPRYGIEEGYNGQRKEGLWANAVGMTSQDMFDRLHGSGPVPAIVRGVSIGGQGDGQFMGDKTLIKNFNPAELSVTAFPGIPDAHIAELSMITESLWKQSDPRSKLNRREKSGRIPIREIGTGPGQTNTPVVGSSPRPGIRGLNASVDSDVRKDMTYQVPQSTYDDPSRPQVNPYDTPSGQAPFQSRGADTYAHLKGQSSTEGQATGAGYDAKSSRDAHAWSPKIPKTGRTTTQTPGFGGLSPSGTGLQDQDEAVYKARVQTVTANLMNDMNKVLYALRTGKAPQEAKVDVSKPEEEEEGEEEGKIKAEDEEEEEEHRRDLLIMRHIARINQRKLARELDYNLGDQRSPSQGPTGSTSMSNYQRTMNTGPRLDVTHSPPNETEPAQMKPLYSAGSKASAFAPQESYQPTREEEDFAKAANPLKSEEEEEEEEARAMFDYLLSKRMKTMFPEAQMGPGGERPYTQSPIPKTPKLGHTTTKTAGFGKQSPSGTGIKDQPEEEEEEMVTINGIKYKREQAGQADVDKDMKPAGEEEEEEEEMITVNGIQYKREAMPRNPGALLMPSDGKQVTGNPLMRVQRDPDMDGDQDNVNANPVTAGGEENIPQDLIPIEGHAPSLAMGMGQTLWHQYIKKDNTPSQAQTAQMVEAFNRMKQPRPDPYRRIQVKTNESRNALQPIGSGRGTAIPTLPGVPARGMMTTNPTLSQPYQTVSQDMRSIQALATKKLEEIRKLPLSARASTNEGKNLWDAILPDIFERQA